MKNNNPSLIQIQKTIDNWINQFEEGYWPPLSLLAALAEEVGELAREINHIEGFKKKQSSNEKDLEMELADTLFSLICIANNYNIDLSKAFNEVMAKYTTRDINRWIKKSKPQSKKP